MLFPLFLDLKIPLDHGQQLYIYKVLKIIFYEKWNNRNESVYSHVQGQERRPKINTTVFPSCFPFLSLKYLILCEILSVCKCKLE